MRVQWIKVNCIVLTAMLFIVACAPAPTQSPTTSPPTQTPIPTFPTGTFIQANWTLELNADSSYHSSSVGADEYGSYTVTDNQVVFKGDYCKEALGTYTWAYDGNVLSFNAVDDKCTDRKGVLGDSKWRMKP